MASPLSGLVQRTVLSTGAPVTPLAEKQTLLAQVEESQANCAWLALVPAYLSWVG